MVNRREDAFRSRHGYDRLAAWYRPLEMLAFGAELQRARTALLDQLGGCQRILLLGDGDGRLLQALLACHAECRVTTVERSRRMLQRQRARIAALKAEPRVHCVRADARRYAPPRESFDAVITPFFLDCFASSDLDLVISHLHAALAQEGRWYCVDFQWPRSGWARWRAAGVLYGLHLFFRWQTGLPNRRLLDLEPRFDRWGMRLAVRVDRNYGLLSSRIYRKSNDSRSQRLAESAERCLPREAS